MVSSKAVKAPYVKSSNGLDSNPMLWLDDSAEKIVSYLQKNNGYERNASRKTGN